MPAFVSRAPAFVDRVQWFRTQTRRSSCMFNPQQRSRIVIQCALTILSASCLVSVAMADAREFAYHAIVPTLSDQTITLSGHDLTIDQVIAIARHGAKVRLSPEAKQREEDNYGLLLEAQAEGVPMYRFNRGGGAGREVVTLEGDPMSAK